MYSQNFFKLTTKHIAIKFYLKTKQSVISANQKLSRVIKFEPGKIESNSQKQEAETSPKG